MSEVSSTQLEFYSAQSLNDGLCMGALMKKVLNAISSQVDTQLETLGLTYAQWFPLRHLSLKGSSTALSMAKELAVDAGALTRALDRLEAKGFISRARSHEDRRVIQIQITEKGQLVAQQVPNVLAQVLNAHLKGIQEERRMVFIQTLHELANQADQIKADQLESVRFKSTQSLNQSINCPTPSNFS